MQSNPIPSDVVNHLVTSGFNPPSTAWTRDNPRGREYGQWLIWSTGIGFAARHVATEYDDGFMIRFDSAEDLAAWIRHTF